ncbi:unnamed protein product [Cochlearia groenlandica]
MSPPHFLLVTFPAQGHVNPSLRFAHRLIEATGARVTFATCLSVFNCSLISNKTGLEVPSLAIRDLPSFLTPTNTNTNAYKHFQELMEFLKEETNPKILVNTFDSLEPEALTAFPNIQTVAIGPLLPSEIFSRNTETVKDLSKEQSSYSLWLDSKTESSVIYVSFGTMVELSKKQINELAKGLIESKRPFLWVITDKLSRENDKEGEEEVEIEKISGLRQELEEIGMIVSWCSQVEVLRHRAVGCFVTHCGWNSTLESLVLGVPVVAFPMWSDQPTNAKLLEERWKTGVRVRENEEGLVEKREIKTCLEAVMEEKALEFKENAEK